MMKPIAESSDERNNKSATTSSNTTPKRSTGASFRAIASPRPNNALKRHHTDPITSAEPGELTPGSRKRLEEIQRALRFRDNQETPIRNKQKNRVVIVSSDEEDDVTDIDSCVVSPTRSASFQEKPPTSAPSSSSSLFSLTSSIGSIVSKQPADDLFNPRPLSPSPESHPLSPHVLRFARSPFGTELEIMVIAHCQRTQKVLDEHQIAWGVQYEIARRICSGLLTWEEVESQVGSLQGNNSEAVCKVERMMKGQAGIKLSDLHVWKQLDLEQDAILENIGRGLGLMGEFQGFRDWYGGKIQQAGRLVKEAGSLKIKLEKMESRRSHRFGRYYGSRRFLHIRVSKDLIQKEREDVRRFFRQKFVLCGRIFVAFHAKERHVYLVETDENYDRQPQQWCGDHHRQSFNQFINWHNPLEVVKNTKQVITKYTARFALGLSNSRPALEFEERNIFFIDDITSDDWPTGKRGAPAEKLMTDGCGLLNHSALQAVVQTVGYDFIPAGIQGRIGGSKGFFILHPTDTSSEPRVWIRTSQHKIQYDTVDRAQRILDLLCASQPSPPSALTKQSTINLFANGVKKELLVKLTEHGLEEVVAPLLYWDKPNATLFLHDAINNCGGVSSVRTQRIAYSLNRVLGLKGRDWHDDDGLIDDDGLDELEDEDDGEVLSGRNEYSGAPLSLHEATIELLQSGFDPRKNQYLQGKIGYIVGTVIRSFVEKHRIPLPESAMSFIVPDPLGILEEGEVFYRFSRPRKDPETDLLQYALEGEILIGRYPIRLPSDIQRVKAIYRRELDRWPDVLVVSVKGKRSIASLLADGDMDGDEAIVIYNKLVVDLFKNRPFSQPPPNFINDNFNRDVESVEKFCERVSALSTSCAHEAFQDVLMSNLSESIVGLYSMFHEKGCLRYGYDNPESIRLAYVFATLLDSSKNGCRLKDGILQKDRISFGPKPFTPKNVSSAGEEDILAILELAGQEKGAELMDKYSNLQTDEWARDKALCKPFLNAMKIAKKYSDRGFKEFGAELERIKDHVDEAYKLFRPNDCGAPSEQARKKKQNELMLQCAKLFAEPVAGIEFITNEDELKASYAHMTGSISFGFQVAFRRLCLLKAESMPGGLVACTRFFDEAKKISPSFLKALDWADEDHLETSAS